MVVSCSQEKNGTINTHCGVILVLMVWNHFRLEGPWQNLGQTHGNQWNYSNLHQQWQFTPAVQGHNFLLHKRSAWSYQGGVTLRRSGWWCLGKVGSIALSTPLQKSAIWLAHWSTALLLFCILCFWLGKMLCFSSPVMAILVVQISGADISYNWDLGVWLSSLIHSNLLRTGANRALLVFRYDTNQSKVAVVLPSAKRYFHLLKIETLTTRMLKHQWAIILYSGWVCSLWAFIRMAGTKIISSKRSLEKSSKQHWKKGRKSYSDSFLNYKNITQILLKLAQEVVCDTWASPLLCSELCVHLIKSTWIPVPHANCAILVPIT